MFQRIVGPARAASAILFCAVTAAPKAAQAAVIQGPITNPANGHQYYKLSASSWADAQAEARALGGDLATVNDAAENDWIVETLLEHNTVYWIGLNDAEVEGDYRWISGEVSDYRNWYPNHPDPTSTYAAILADRTRQWLAFRPDDYLWQGVVEVVPEPTALVPAAVLLTLLRRRPRKQ